MDNQTSSSLFADMDDATAALILQLQIDDAQEYINQTPAPGISIPAVSDGRATLEIYKAELEREKATLEDRKVAFDVDPLGIGTRFYMLLAARARPEPAAVPAPAPPVIPEPPARTHERCVSCDEFLFPQEVEIDIPCNHMYCVQCIEELFSQSLVDESLFPPRCCKQPIPVDNVREILAPDFIQTFQDKKQEIETVDRTYCSDPRCSIFMRPKNISGDRATCPTCQQVTCTMCKAPSHDGICPADEGTQQVLELARENGWQRCPVCQVMVSISTGCNHMRCRCGAGWCYQCAARWNNNVKTCECPQWEENLLLRRANEVVNLEGPQEGQTREEQMEAAIETLNVHCEHDRGWAFSHGSAQCANCSQVMPVFTLQCNGCVIHWCRRCTLNRA